MEKYSIAHLVLKIKHENINIFNLNSVNQIGIKKMFTEIIKIIL